MALRPDVWHTEPSPVSLSFSGTQRNAHKGKSIAIYEVEINDEDTRLR